MAIIINTKTVAFVLILNALLLLVWFLIGQYFALYLGHPHVFGLVYLFDLNEEGNIPTLYSSVLLLFSAVLLSLVGYARLKTAQPWAWHWLGLGIILLFLSIDEGAALHEMLIDPVRSAINPGGVLHQAPWIIPYSVIAVGIAAAYFRFLFQLPQRTKFLFFSAGLLYVGGAMGVELLGGVHHELYGKQLDGLYVLLIALEEMMEMGGVIMLIVGILSYIEAEMPNLHIRMRDSSEQ